MGCTFASANYGFKQNSFSRDQGQFLAQIQSTAEQGLEVLLLWEFDFPY